MDQISFRSPSTQHWGARGTTSALFSLRVGPPRPANPTKLQPLPSLVPPTPDPRAGLHPELRAPTQLPFEDLEFSYHKRASVPLAVPAASPAERKAELFLENSRVCSRTQDGACTREPPPHLRHQPAVSPSLCAHCSVCLPGLPLPLSATLCLALTLPPSISLLCPVPLLSLPSSLPSPFSPNLLRVSSPPPSPLQILFLDYWRK